ncbi:hypothetical protein [Pedobacter alpinus]|uniref:DUF4890 domain-containing protein n=1 Tax=Pedobacter alpinus TaxID=1590643 RepID=A0ABW5TTN8_9SPHI
MKKYLLSIALLVAVSATSFAQQKSAEDRAKKTTETMDTNLTLTAEQKTKIYDANVEKIKATDALKLVAGEGNKPDAEKMKAVNKKFNDVVKATLTEEQKAKMAEMKAQNAKPKEN